MTGEIGVRAVAISRYNCLVISDPSRILIVRLSAIGDVIHGIPVLCALRSAFPNALIGWVVEGRAGDLLRMPNDTGAP